MSLNTAQQQAVEAEDGPQLILAGAGSGKTRTVVHRIGHLIAQRGYAPHRILAVTFTNKAAKELQQRLSDLIGDGGGGVISGTFHSISLRFLRSYADVLGYPKSFQVIDSDDQKTLVKRILKARSIPSDRLHPSFLASWIEQQKNAGYLPEQAESMLWSGLDLKDLYIAYQDELKQLERMDFSDLILNCVRLLREHKDVATAMFTRFDHILVDEYQDTNPLQHEWLCLLAQEHQNITVVGDDDQSIYGWRGADVRHILDFGQVWNNAQTHKLEDNYRSTESILKLANAIISNNEDRHLKQLNATREGGLKPEFHVCVDEYAEARHMAKLFNERYATVQWSKMAVLYRSNRQSLAIEQVFREEDIPYRIIGGLSFFARMEIKDALAFWALLNDCADGMHMLRVCNKPKRGIGAKGQETIATLLSASGLRVADWIASMLQATSVPAPMKKLLPLLQLMQEVKPEIEDKADRGLMLLLEKSGYIDSLKALGDVESESRLENIKTLQNYIELSLESGITPIEFMDRAALMVSGEEDNDDEDAVNLMSLHRAKGLEFDTVVLAGVEDGMLPHQRALDEGEAGIAEERRLLYVGVTRAENILHLTSARLRRMFGDMTYPMPSRFIADLDDDVLCKSEKIQQPHMFSQAKATSSAQGITVGAYVNHPSFGDGLIVDLEGDGDAVRVAIEFDAVGLKRLMLKYAALTVL
ncbi:MAG: UvrD-helicase domain-containing protein [Ghiorsea sp.]|nr:UvrD-helicase domain-containing protein [Ghiorsea sp.]